MLLNFQRIIKSGAVSFWRNVWLSTAAVAIMVLNLFVISSFLLGNVVADSLLNSLENKIDISVYFKQDTEEKDILSVKSELMSLGEIKDVNYVSAEEALSQFKERHKGNSILLQSLEEVGDNPFEAALSVKTRQASQYEAVSLFLENGKYKNLIDGVDFRQNQAMIDKLTYIVGASRKVGGVVSLTFIFIAVLVTFNTIRLAIFSAKEEISVMRLVGASNWFIQGPFMVEGILYGLVASLVTMLIFAPVLSNIAPYLYNFTQSVDIWQYFKDNFWALAALQTAIGVSLGTLSSFIAIRRYLKV
ncbi:MAG: Cell division protein [Candidatus Azambacteria bacterium GW2011_GWB2_46_37]|uniref:Cell division protein FtsX n=3 Tax=Candidatus Azamiibacteriota TaxID=1752741 RepID=A0A0G1SAC4_9BACT|nr:MAG: Cell division protein [Candidatus Azambacteria bacterium GW2011_GWB2_46_37]KKU39038.1 MAG: Cell division protein [Candidatus Azambacteria bacterium GW2011_GWE2_46_45]KKU40197.1 MAG: Cell division protein [Candidatus Azambacteria bacterium GW2011_GWD2_46_48]HCB36471.1 hypothetical protein [Candidatus Azambacteria bacterium]